MTQYCSHLLFQTAVARLLSPSFGSAGSNKQRPYTNSPQKIEIFFSYLHTPAANVCYARQQADMLKYFKMCRLLHNIIYIKKLFPKLYVSLNSLGMHSFLRLNVLLKLDMLLKPHL